MNLEHKKVLDFWFPDKKWQKNWFSPDTDDIIRECFQELLSELSRMSCDELKCMIDSSNKPYQMGLSIILCLDQFTRHVSRNTPKFNSNDPLCYELVEKLYEQKFHMGLPINQRIFFFLPFRHQRTTEHSQLVLREITVMHQENERQYINTSCYAINQDIINRFYRATIKQMTEFRDSTRTVTTPLADFKLDHKTATNILDPLCLPTYGQLPPTDTITNTLIYKHILEFIKEHKINAPCVSLSGGVDSMVIAYVLVYLRDVGIISFLSAVHIDYTNRDVSREEADFVERWCRYYEIPFITRRIEHINRSKSPDRSLYETETKKMRFLLYAMSNEEYKTDCIMMGHHQGDVIENILLNFLQNRDLFNLDSMTGMKHINGQNIARPLLELKKSDIYSFAHQYCIPYLKNTTLSTCNRGMLREQLLPLVEQMIPNFSQNMLNIGKRSKEWGCIINSHITRPTLDSVVECDNGFFFPWKQDYAEMPRIWWANINSAIFHQHGYAMLKEKNMTRFMGWIKTRNTMCSLSNGLRYFYEHETLVVAKNTIFNTTNVQLPIAIGDTTQIEHKIGIWNIHISPEPNLRAQEGNITIENFLNGEFQYIYETCVHSLNDSKCSISYSFVNKHSSSYTFLHGHKFTPFLPKVYMGRPCSLCYRAPMCFGIICSI
jgi:tRNA(Ile)-lysidine synthetase-like protein